LAEPSLALTVPKQPSETDGGLLTASEVAQLKLNADWVVLSACNTIVGEKPDTKALSALAGAFFYAGARSCSSRSGGALMLVPTTRLCGSAIERSTFPNQGIRPVRAALSSEA
jgi:hypothetical protein